MENTDKIIEKEVRNRPFTPNDGLTEKQWEAVQMLLEGQLSKGEIADKLGIHRNTLTNWLRMDNFNAAVDECASEKYRQMVRYIGSKAPIALARLWKLAESSSDKRVCREIYTYFVDRAMGKVTAKIEMDDKRTNEEDYNIMEALERIEDNTTPLSVRYGKLG